MSSEAATHSTTIRHRVGLIGAGHICEFHIAALRRTPGVELLGIHDVDPKRAEQTSRRFDVKIFPSLAAFREAGADVVHVLTPPDTHSVLTIEALQLGLNVLVEKPLATDVGDCRTIQRIADERGLRVCVNHSLLYDVQVRRALEAVRAGAIGELVSVDVLTSSVYPPYEGGPLPPPYRSAGYPFRDLGVHALYLIQAFLGPIEDVNAQWASLGGDPNLVFDEWQAQVRCRQGLGHLRLSWNVKPLQNLLLLQGTAGVMRVDTLHMFQARRIALPVPKAAERIANVYIDSLQPMIEVPQNVVGFLRKKIRQYHGVQELIVDFYRRLDRGDPVPVSVVDAIPVVDWVERVARAAEADHLERRRRAPQRASSVRFLVTGAAGAVGSAVVGRLRERGEQVRAFVRRVPRDPIEGVEYVVGDLGNPTAVEEAVRGARIVIHAGAAMKGGWVEHRTSTVIGTQNVIDACLEHGVEQLVYISSMSVVDWAGGKEGDPITESSPLEPRPENRGAYTRAKREAELLVRKAVREQGLRAVVLRPGQIFGGKLPLSNATNALRINGRYVLFGDGTLRLPLVYIDDVVDAVLAVVERRLVGGEIIQLVDPEPPTENEVLQYLGGRKVLRIPRPAAFALGKVSEAVLGALGRESPLSTYRLRTLLAKRTYRSDFAGLIGWTPRVGVAKGIELSAKPRD